MKPAKQQNQITRRIPIGAELMPEGGAHFRVWAPKCSKVEIVIDPQLEQSQQKIIKLEPEEQGYFSGFIKDAQAGTLYKFKLDDNDYLYPDPASRFQPQGPHGPSCIIDASSFNWTDQKWPGVALEGQVIYEMHIGTFTREGSWRSAAAELKELADLGITVLEVMPVADFPGKFGWGYDGVNLFAPTHIYGEPDDFRYFINTAHELGLGVILDVVYNHFGPDGNYLKPFSDDYFTDRYGENDWGECINFDDKNCEPVREFFVANVKYFMEEFHLDGLRLDATPEIHDDAKEHEHILLSISKQVRASSQGRSTIIVAENERQASKLVRPEASGGYGIDALWNDDFHHSAMVRMTGRAEAYYTDYLGTPQEFISAIKWGYLYQGQRYKWQSARRGFPSLDIKPAAFVIFIQNHDQIANSATGARCHQLTSPGIYRAMTALMLLGPGTPMLFQGQEFASSSPFFYFADHHEELAQLVKKGRREFLEQFPSIALPEINQGVPDPADAQTFESCKLDFSERQKHGQTYALHRDLLKLRKEDPAFKLQKHRGVDGAVLGEQAFVLRFFVEQGQDRLLLVNFGSDLRLDPAPDPLLAPVENMEWAILWSSEDPSYGGSGTPLLDTEENWKIPGQAAVVLKPVPAKPAKPVKPKKLKVEEAQHE